MTSKNVWQVGPDVVWDSYEWSDFKFVPSQGVYEFPLSGMETTTLNFRFNTKADEENEMPDDDLPEVVEYTRTYYWADGATVVLSDVVEASVNPWTGAHRVKTVQDSTIRLNVVPAGWIHLVIDPTSEDYEGGDE